MKRLLVIFGLAAASLLPTSASWAQLAAPNDAGVTMGHLSLNVPDVEASKQFWISLGGTEVKASKLNIVKFPNVLIILTKADPTGGTSGSIVNHAGFLVQDGAASMAKWKALGTKLELNASGRGGFVYTPEGLRLEIPERKTIPAPIVFDQIHFFVAEPAADGGSSVKEMQEWYQKVFGATPGQTGGLPNNYYEEQIIPGVHLRFSKTDPSTVGTKGRALDHIGFEVKNLQEFCKKAAANGVKFDSQYKKHADTGVATAFLTDPWGTYIELTEGLDRF